MDRLGTSRHPSEPLNGQQPLLFDATGALALSELVCSLKRKK
jgi:hypothetical protein